nr:unnamed protein product [Callosobruchus analis]
MQSVIAVFVLSCFLESGFSILTEQEYVQIPQLHDMDDVSTCQKENRIVCKIYFNILPPNSTSNKAWNIIQQSKKSDINQYRKDKLKRFRCLPNRFLGKEEIAKSVVATENELLKKYSLHVDIQKMYCRRYSDINLTSFDFVVLSGTIGLFIILLSATIIDARYVDIAEVILGKRGVKYIKYFSWSSNWKALIRSTGKDGQKLKALQGMRVLSTMYIIHFHISIVVSSELLLKDPRFLEQCNPALWSLANDFQMYVISVCLFYIIFKYKKTLMLFVYMTAIFCSIHGYEMYKNGYRHILAFAGERDLDISGIFGKGKFFVMYGSIYVNFGSYAVGVIFGSFYHQYKNIKVENSLKNNLLWACFMFVFPTVVLYFTTFTYSTLWAAIIGPFVKPSASLCLAIGIFGMTLGLGGFFKRFCESNFMQLIANWQYSVYYSHLGIVFSKIIFVNHLFYVSVFKLALIYVWDITASYASGLAVYLCIEKPFSNIVHDLMNPRAIREVKEKQLK